MPRDLVKDSKIAMKARIASLGGAASAPPPSRRKARRSQRAARLSHPVQGRGPPVLSPRAADGRAEGRSPRSLAQRITDVNPHWPHRSGGSYNAARRKAAANPPTKPPVNDAPGTLPAAVERPPAPVAQS